MRHDERPDPGRTTPLPVTVVGGYLGAGKTTLIDALLRRPLERRIGVVVNDFGELSIDAERLASVAEDGLVTLPNGCVCCTLGDDLGATLDELARRTPPLDQVVVEASGVADPVTIAAWGTTPPYAPGGVIVVAAADDVRRLARDRYVGAEVRRQLAAADIVVLSGVDRCTTDQVVAVTGWLGALTIAPVVPAIHGDLDPVLVLGVAPGDGPGSGAVGATVDVGSAAHLDTVGYRRWSWTPDAARPSDDLPSIEAVRAFLAALPPTVLRLKGRLMTTAGAVAVDLAGSRRSVRPVDSRDGRPAVVGLVAIGVDPDGDPVALDGLAAHYLSP